MDTARKSDLTEEQYRVRATEFNWESGPLKTVELIWSSRPKTNDPKEDLEHSLMPMSVEDAEWLAGALSRMVEACRAPKFPGERMPEWDTLDGKGQTVECRCV